MSCSELERPEPRGVLYTIGHSNHTEEEFVTLLRTHDIEVLVDVRSQPYSRYATHFSAESIRHVVEEAGVQYLFLGKELGGRPDGDEYYDEDGHVLYRRVAASALFLEGIGRLQQGIVDDRLSVMCSEEDPAICHRHLLIGRVMAQRGFEICHIRGDGRLQSVEELQPASGNNERQGMLFSEMERDSWRSLRSVLPKPPPVNSSES